ncbi:MAG: peptide chain release factor 1 [Anaerolineae bacterium]|nr:peptide chain release factor 1 [Anaerolineae bacterium]
MLDKLQRIAERFQEINQEMAQPELATDYLKLADLARERSELEPLVNKYQEHASVLAQIDEARELLDDEEMADLAQAELDELEPRSERLFEELKRMLLPKDPRDDKNVIVEIRAGAGGDEAGLFGAELARMYMRYAENRNWKTEILSANETGVGGYKEVVFSVDGKGAYSRLKFESGVHRVQRVPVTESSGRIHTSTATVAVLPEMGDVDIEINPADIEMETYCASGPGGQHMQKNATAVRIIHKPSGLVVTCENQRSLTQNRLQAMAVLRTRLYAIEEQKQFDEQDQARRSQVGSGDRSEKIRTYNFPQSRVTDHRIGLSTYNLEGVLNGNLDAFIDELATTEEAERLQSLSDSS